MHEAMSLADESIRGNECRAVLENKYVKEALDAIEAAMIDGIVMCPIKDQALQSELVNVLRAKRKFVEHLESHIVTGELAKRQQAVDEARKDPNFFKKLFA